MASAASLGIPKLDIIDAYTQKNKKIFACFVDYQKAYDNIWREGLYLKLIKEEINVELINIIHSMYNETTQQIKVGNKLTKPFNAYRGVRQGCVLSPLLFNIYVNDLPRSFDKSCSPVMLEDLKINCLMYADDILLLSETEEGLKQCIDKLCLYNKKWRLNINESKSCLLYTSDAADE